MNLLFLFYFSKAVTTYSRISISIEIKFLFTLGELIATSQLRVLYVKKYTVFYDNWPNKIPNF